MNRWLRRFLYLLLLLFWLVVMLFPAISFVLATRQQIQLGSSPDRHLRLFLVSEPATQGLGLERTRPVSEPANCTQTTVNYLMWQGEGESTTYCQCYNESGGVISTNQGACAPP